MKKKLNNNTIYIIKHSVLHDILMLAYSHGKVTARNSFKTYEREVKKVESLIDDFLKNGNFNNKTRYCK